MNRTKGKGRTWSKKLGPGDFTTTAVVATSPHGDRKKKINRPRKRTQGKSRTWSQKSGPDTHKK